MKKFIAMLFVIALCVPSIFAQGGEHTNYKAANAALTTTAATVASSACYVSYIVVNTTGVLTAKTVRILDGGTTMFTLVTGTAAGTSIIDLSRTPVLFSTSVIVDSDGESSGSHSTVVYRVRN